MSRSQRPSVRSSPFHEERDPPLLNLEILGLMIVHVLAPRNEAALLYGRVGDDAGAAGLVARLHQDRLFTGQGIPHDVAGAHLGTVAVCSCPHNPARGDRRDRRVVVRKATRDGSVKVSDRSHRRRRSRDQLAPWGSIEPPSRSYGCESANGAGG